jgi:hypothetical protein
MSSPAAAPPAKIGDKLVTTRSRACGFAAVGKPDAPIYLLPGTELAFEKVIKYYHRFSLLRFSRGHKTAKFRQFDIGKCRGEHDAIEFPDGRIVMVSELVGGQTATVVRAPPSAQPA